MHIALTGASGFIGSVICREANAAGHSITALVRESSRRDHVRPHVDRFVIGDQADRDAWPALLDGADAVIHNSVDWIMWRHADQPDAFSRHLQSNLVASIELLRHAAPRPFVFLSTIAVHHDMRPRWNALIDEDHPLRPNTDYGAYKAAVEAHLWADHFRSGRHTAAIRPCAVYGIDPKLERSQGHPIIRRIADERRFDKPGGGKFVHVDDVARACLAACTSKTAAGRPVNLVDCYARWADWANYAAEALGIEADIDCSSPDRPKNHFSKDAARELLGVPLERGHEGIRTAVHELIGAMRQRGEL